jgi:hypothetical protein
MCLRDSTFCRFMHMLQTAFTSALLRGCHQLASMALIG